MRNKPQKYIIFLVLFLISILPCILFSGTTGKIAGKVLDVETGQGLAGVNVIIEGTTLGAATGLDGSYIILMVPPGVYTIKASMIGYQTHSYENVRVSIDKTTRLEFKISTTILDMGQEVTVVAERPLVQMDLTSSESVIGSETIKNLPVDNFQDVVNLQAGVVEGHFRGGRAGEVMYMVDGIPVNDVYSGSYAFEVENSAVAELEVISGTFNAEYGQAMSGVVNIVTKDGGDTYSGHFSTYFGDYVSTNKDIFWNIDKINPTYNFEASLHGPVPFTNKKLTFYFTGRLLNRDGYYYGKKVFLPSDMSDFSAPNSEDWVIMSHGKTYPYSEEKAKELIENADAEPMNPVQRYNTMLKVTYKLTASDILNYELMINDQYNKDYNHEFRLNPDGTYKRYTNGYNNSLIWTHVFNERTFSSLKLNNFLTKYKQYVYEDPYDSRYVSLRRLQDSGANAFLTGGMEMWNFQRSTNTTLAKFDITSQVSNTHQLKLGFEAKRHELWLHEFEVVTDSDQRIPAPTAFNNNEYTHYPKEVAVYVQDKMEFEYMIVNAGIRFDYFDPDAVSLLNYLDPANSQTEKVKATSQISPRLGLAYPISSQGVIHVSYGHFFQTPNYDYLYVNPDFELYPLQSAVSTPPNSTLNILGNAMLKPQKTVIYEIGFQQQLSEDFALDVTTYRKDIRNLLGTEVHRLTTGNYYAQYINRDYANVKGFTISLEKRQKPGITGVGASIDYTFQVAKGNASDPNDAFLNAQSGRETLKKMSPLDWDRRHQLNSTLTIGDPGNYNVSLIGRLATGFPYTAVYGTEAYVENGARRPMIYSFDLYFNKNFTVGKLSYAAFLRIFNLFDQLNEREVFPETGRAGYSLTPFWQSYLHPRGINDIEDYFVRPDFYSAPREVQIGFSVEF